VNNGFGNHDLWITKLDGETWEKAVSRFSLYPEDMEALAAWAAVEDSKCLLGTSQTGCAFFIPAELSPQEAANEEIQRQAQLAKAEKDRRDAERDAEIAHLRAEAEYRARYLRPGVPQHIRDLAAVELMTSEQLEERLRPEVLNTFDPQIVDAICERYLKLEGVLESEMWKNLPQY
jgi:hypothetical protein